jgi:hypothetical protein
MATNDETASLMQSLLGQDDLVRVEVDDFEDFTEFMESTRFNFVQLGI